MRTGTFPRRHSTRRTTWGCCSRTGMQSVSRIEPVAVSNSVSSTKVPSR